MFVERVIQSQSGWPKDDLARLSACCCSKLLFLYAFQYFAHVTNRHYSFSPIHFQEITTREWVDVPRLNFDSMIAGESSSPCDETGVSECTIVIDGNEEPSEDLLDFEFVPET